MESVGCVDWIVCCMIASGGRVDLFGRLVRVGELYRPKLGGSRGDFVGHEDCARRGM